MNYDEALTALERALSFVSADDAVVTLNGSLERATRFANSAITQNVSGGRATVTVTAAYGHRTGSASTNQTDPESLAQTVRRAEAAARAADPDLEYLGPLPPQQYPVVQAYSEATAGADAAERARMVLTIVRAAAQAGGRAAGSVTTSVDCRAVANSAGLRAWHEGTSARVVATVLANGASGWAGVGSYDLERVPVERIADDAARKAREARDPVEVEPGPTTVVLAPQAVADLIEWIVWDGDAKAADEGRSAFSGLEGHRVAAPFVSIRSLPTSADAPGVPFADDGAATRDVAWVENGILRSLPTGRYWAQNSGRLRVDYPETLLMDGAEGSVEDLVARVDSGLLVTRFWYIRYVDPMKLLLTGMTRDGLYRIADGKVRGAALNMRFNESPLRVLNQAVAVGSPVLTRGGILAPPMVVKGFRFTSVTRF